MRVSFVQDTNAIPAEYVLQPVTDRFLHYNDLIRLRDKLDPVSTATFNETDEVQTIPTFNGVVSGGNFTITVVDPADGSSITTANIAHNANAATIETALDTVCTGNITGWTNGDISVSGGDLTTANVLLTYDGSSVDGQNIAQCTITDVDLSGGGTVTAATTTTNGQAARKTWAVMWALGLIAAADLPAQGSALADGATLWVTAAENAVWPNAALRGALAEQAAIDDANPTLETQLKALFRVQ